MVPRRMFFVAALILACPTAGWGQVDPGSIAVMPFGSGFRTQCALDCAQAMSNVVEEQLARSGRFSAVLPRSREVEAAVKRLLEEAEGPGRFDSYIQISTEAGLNANYLLDGRVENLTVTPERRGDVVAYDARMTVRIRIVDVESSALVLSKGVVVGNGLLEGMIGGTQEECGRMDLACRARNAAAEALEGAVEANTRGLGADETPQQAIQSAVANAGDAIRAFIQREISLQLIDYDVDDNGVANELVIASAPDLEQGMVLDVATRTESRRTPDTRDRTIGAAEVTQIDGDVTYARLTSGVEAIAKALEEGDFVVVKPRQGSE